jgi:hypothetical protein
MAISHQLLGIASTHSNETKQLMIDDLLKTAASKLMFTFVSYEIQSAHRVLLTLPHLWLLHHVSFM